MEKALKRPLRRTKRAPPAPPSADDAWLARALELYGELEAPFAKRLFLVSQKS